ncbi:MAG: hypothetical protein LBJ77_02620, partial [Holosporales bacterium]|nr:hypothetical protein [Holosporales bacterium]
MAIIRNRKFSTARIFQMPMIMAALSLVSPGFSATQTPQSDPMELTGAAAITAIQDQGQNLQASPAGSAASPGNPTNPSTPPENPQQNPTSFVRSSGEVFMAPAEMKFPFGTGIYYITQNPEDPEIPNILNKINAAFADGLPSTSLAERQAAVQTTTPGQQTLIIIGPDGQPVPGRQQVITSPDGQQIPGQQVPPPYGQAVPGQQPLVTSPNGQQIPGQQLPPGQTELYGQPAPPYGQA